MKRVTTLKDIPSTPHYVIVSIASVHIPGDERSRTHPGHGYPAHTDHYTEMRVTESITEWTKEIEKLMHEDPNQKNFVAYHVDALASISTRVQVSF